MSVTGIHLMESRSGQVQIPEGVEFKGAFLAEHATLRGFYWIDALTDYVTTFTETALSNALKTASLNGDAKFWAAVYLTAPGGITKDTLDSLVDLLLTRHEISWICVLKDADLEFANAFRNALIAQGNKKRYLEGILRWRHAPRLSLAGKAATKSTTNLVITLEGHPFEVGDEILLTKADQSTQPDGRYTISAEDANTFTIPLIADTFVFETGAFVEEHPDEYCMKFSDTFKTFVSTQISIVAPTTEFYWDAACAGRISRIPVQVSAGKILDGGLVNVNVNPFYKDAHITVLDAARAVFLKRFAEDMASVYVNDDNVMFSTVDDITTMAQRRVMNKAKRLTQKHSLPLVNNEKFGRDAEGAAAAGEIAAAGLKQMKKVTPTKSNEIHDYTLSAFWTPKGVGLKLTLIDVNRVKIVEPDLMIVQQEEGA